MSDSRGDLWDEQDAGPVVRLYALTRGRGRTERTDLTLDSMVIDIGSGIAMRRSEPEYAEILRLCRVTQSVAEVSAHLRVPLAVTKVLIGDLIADGRLTVGARTETSVDKSDLGLLETIVNSLRGG